MHHRPDLTCVYFSSPKSHSASKSLVDKYISAQILVSPTQTMIYRFKRRWLFLLVSVLLIGFTFHHTSFRFRFSRIPHQFTSAGFRESDWEVRDLMHFSNYKFSHSDEFQKTVGGWDTFAAKTQTEKCEEFFTFLNNKIPKWKASLFRNRLYDKHVVNKAGYFSDNHARVLKQKNLNPETVTEITNEDRRELDSWYDDAVKRTLQTEQDMADCMTVIRNFGHCFTGANAASSDKLHVLFQDFAPRVLPYFKNNLPIVTGVIGSNTFFDGSPSFDENSEFIEYYLKNMKGTGIVISASTRHVRDTVKLIHILRAMGNTLPIQVIYRTDISSLAKTALERAASAPKDELLSNSHMETKTLSDSLRSFGLNEDSVKQRDFPSQNLTLIDMQKTLSSMARSEFSGYNNKIAALFFASFERVLLLDADTVPLMRPESFFKLQEYIETGAYFFKDRSLIDRNGWVETNYFAKLMPQKSDSLDMAMGVKPVTNHTMRNDYMQGWRHCQEAGVVLLDRKAHFPALLVLLTLSLWGEPAKSSVWGDKELYWLAMSIAGDEKYVFNVNSAASVGEFTGSKDMKQYNTTESLELCSSHPGHISSTGELLWINSGFAYCKMNGFMRDREKFPFSLFENPDAVKTIYDAPLKIRHAIVPPSNPAFRSLNGPADLTSEESFTKLLKGRKKDVDDMADVYQLGDYGPQKGWVKSPLCSNYQYCAYNEINSIDGSGAIDRGQVFTFDLETTKTFDILGSIWISAKRYSERKPKTEKNKPETDPIAPDKKQDKEQIDPKSEKVNPPSEEEVVYDPSRVLNRPEKLNADINGILNKLTSAQKQKDQ